MPPNFVAETIWALCDKFSMHQNVFALCNIKSIMGKLGDIASTAPWLWFLLPDLYVEITKCLKLHHNHLHMANKQFRTLLKLQCDQ